MSDKTPAEKLLAPNRHTAHQRIMRAAKEGKGLRLTADEVFDLSLDDAIMTAAQVDDGEDPR